MQRSIWGASSILPSAEISELQLRQPTWDRRRWSLGIRSLFQTLYSANHPIWGMSIIMPAWYTTQSSLTQLIFLYYVIFFCEKMFWHSMALQYFGSSIIFLRRVLEIQCVPIIGHSLHAGRRLGSLSSQFNVCIYVWAGGARRGWTCVKRLARMYEAMLRLITVI